MLAGRGWPGWLATQPMAVYLPMYLHANRRPPDYDYAADRFRHSLIAMAAALFSPLLDHALDAYPLELARYRAQADALAEEGTALRRELDRGIIEREMEAYILDKADALGAEIGGAAVALRWSTEGVWLPESAQLTGRFHAGLSRAIEAELGIPRSAQVWRTDEEP